MENMRKAQEEAAKVQKELSAAEFEGFSPCETVRVVMTGAQEPRSVDITEEASLSGWHRARLQPPTEYAIRVDYAEREKAKVAGCRWNPDIKKWVFACHGAPPRFVLKRRLDQPAATASAAAAAAA